jgi:hypothetical protein
VQRLEGGWRRRDANSCSTEDKWSSVGKKRTVVKLNGKICLHLVPEAPFIVGE